MEPHDTERFLEQVCEQVLCNSSLVSAEFRLHAETKHRQGGVLAGSISFRTVLEKLVQLHLDVLSPGGRDHTFTALVTLHITFLDLLVLVRAAQHINRARPIMLQRICFLFAPLLLLVVNPWVLRNKFPTILIVGVHKLSHGFQSLIFENKLLTVPQSVISVLHRNFILAQLIVKILLLCDHIKFTNNFFGVFTQITHCLCLVLLQFNTEIRLLKKLISEVWELFEHFAKRLVVKAHSEALCLGDQVELPILVENNVVLTYHLASFENSTGFEILHKSTEI